MSIDSLRSGAIRICFDPSLNVYPNKCRILIEGQMLDSGTAVPNQLIKIPSLRGVEELFGYGSVISEGLKTAFGCCPNQAMEFYALPRADTDVGAVAKASYELEFGLETRTPPITGAASDGRIDLFMGDGRWNTSTRVREGDTPDVIAVAVNQEIMDLPGFPFDSTVTGNTITLTAKNAGTVGNCLNVIYNWHGRRDYAPDGITFDFSQPTAGTMS